MGAWPQFDLKIRGARAPRTPTSLYPPLLFIFECFRPTYTCTCFLLRFSHKGERETRVTRELLGRSARHQGKVKSESHPFSHSRLPFTHKFSSRERLLGTRPAVHVVQTRLRRFSAVEKHIDENFSCARFNKDIAK